MLKGSLTQIDLAEVFRLLTSSQQTGLLHIMNMGETVAAGGCYFQLGRVVHANMGRFTGLDALNEICRVSDGTFAFEAGVAAPAQSLAQYPTATLVQMISDQLQEQRALAAHTPQPDDVLRYQPGKSLEGLEATPDELAVLLLCDGVRRVQDIAAASGMAPRELRAALARFRLAGLLELVDAPVGQSSASEAVTATPPGPIASPSPSALPAESAGETPPAEERRVVRYWRGKPIYE